MLSVVETLFKMTVLLLVAACLLWLPSTAMGEEGVPVCGIRGAIQAWKLNVREKPLETAPVAGVLDRGTDFLVVGGNRLDEEWLKISGGGVTGYVRNRPVYIRLSQDGREIDPAVRQKNLQSVIRAEEKTLETAARNENDIIGTLEDIDKRAAALKLHLDGLKREQKTLAAGLERIRDEQKRVEAIQKRKQAYAHARLNALYRVNMAGKMHMAAPPDSLVSLLFQRKALGLILENDVKILADYAEMLKKVHHLSTAVEAKQREKDTADRQLSSQVKLLKEEREKKAGLLAQIRTEKELTRSVVASLKDAADKLDRYLESLPGPAAAAPEPGTLFSDLRNALEMPVKGTIVSGYGPSQNSDYSSFTFQSGIDIRVDRGEPVMSVFRGRVLFAQQLRGYGNLIIIDHGENYYTLYAHVEEMFKKKGDLVDTREVIATAGDTGSLKGSCLHFEVRHRGKPDDPLNWLKKGV